MKIKLHFNRLEEIPYMKELVKIKCKQLEFEDDSINELLLVVTEILTNVDKYGGQKADITITEWRDQNDIIGINLLISDYGPGIVNVEEALIDGYSTSGSLGNGLGTIRRLADEFIINSSTKEMELGTQITIKKRKKTQIRNISIKPSSNHDPKKFWMIAGDNKKNTIWNRSAVYWKDNISEIFIAVVDASSIGRHSKLLIQVVMDQLNKLNVDSIKEMLQKLKSLELIQKNWASLNILLLKIDKNNSFLHFYKNGYISIYCVSQNGIDKLLLNNPPETGEPQQSKYHIFNFKTPITFVIHSKGISSRWVKSIDVHDINSQSHFDTVRMLLRDFSDDNLDNSVVVVKNDGITTQNPVKWTQIVNR